MATSGGPPFLRVVPGEVEQKNATTRLVIPTSVQPAWPPFARVGETVANQARQFPAHSHERQEVLTYVNEGFAAYQLESQPVELLRPGSARLLTTPSRSTHRISPARGGAIRWFSLVIGISLAETKEPRLQASEPPSSPTYEDDAIVRSLVGPSAPMVSGILECREITFVTRSTTFRRVGHDRRALVYVLAGRGTVDEHGVEAGEGVLLEGVAGVAVQGGEGFRVIVATAPA